MSFFDSKESKLYIAQYDLAPYLTEIRGFPGPRRMDEITTLADLGQKSIPSIEEGEFSLQGFFNEAADGIDDALGPLRGDTTGKNVLYLPSGGTVGRPGYATGLALLLNAEITSRVGSAVEQAAQFRYNGIVERVKSLGPKVTQAAGANGTSVDDGAGSASGGSWYYHVLAVTATGGNARWNLIIQDSTDNSIFATVDSVFINNGATGGARRTFTGTFDQFVRWSLVLDATSGAITFLAAYKRT